MGLEIETSLAEDVQDLPEGWLQKTDASCGSEFVSGIIKTEEDLIKQVSDTCRILRRVTNTHGRCGLHVHLGAKFQDFSAKYRLFRLFRRYEQLFFDLHKPLETRSTGSGVSRRSFCQKVPDHLWDSMVVNSRAFTHWEKSDRYFWFNGKAYYTHGTVELRIMNGTLAEADILGWMAILAAIVRVVNSGAKIDWKAPSEDTATMLEDLRTHCPLRRGNALDEYGIRLLSRFADNPDVLMLNDFRRDWIAG